MTQPLADSIVLVEYDPSWPECFADEKARIVGAIGGMVADIQHIGSTAVPGLDAKPLIDIMVATRSVDDIAGCVEPLEALGYIHRGEVVFPGGRYFKKLKDGVVRTHNIHLCTADNPEWERHLRFRDYLRSHPAVAREYAALKRELGPRYGADRIGYTEAKGEFIEGCIARARLEPPRTVQIVDYDPRWPAMFEDEKSRIMDAVGEWLVDVQHVGSTSVPGLAAKPIIDMMPTLRDLGDARHCIAPLEALGYEYVPQFETILPERRYFRRGEVQIYSHHVHMVQADTAFWRRHIEFRDYLREHPEAAREYAALKRELAERYRTDRVAYTDAKTEFIRGIEARAAAARSPSAPMAGKGTSTSGR